MTPLPILYGMVIPFVKNEAVSLAHFFYLPQQTCQRSMKLKCHCPVVLLSFTTLAAAMAGWAEGDAGAGNPELIGFNDHVRPILARSCFHCHGPDSGSRKAGLRLDLEAGLFDPENGPTVVKGEPGNSPLYERLTTDDPDDVMPPPDAHETIEAEEIEIIRQWIAQGANWEPHWSFINPASPAVPIIEGDEWSQNAIDRFVLKKVREANLEVTPTADRYTLARRAALDITGLPPTWEQVEKLVNDSSDEAWTTYIDTLLASPRYGEHRARYWLDAARYADTHGVHIDNYREIWPYRDWVINAYNDNVPFDQFTIEQLAGDLLEKPTRNQLIATGFQRCNPTTNEAGTIAEENLANYAADHVQTLGWVYLGLTTNCAKCHDHKFDPITARDYYSLAAFFRNTTSPSHDANTKDGRSATVVIPAAKDEERWAELPVEIADIDQQRSSRIAAVAPSLIEWQKNRPWKVVEESLVSQPLLAALPLGGGPEKQIMIRGGTEEKLSLGEVESHPDVEAKTGAVFELKSPLSTHPLAPDDEVVGLTFSAWIYGGSGKEKGLIAKQIDPVTGRGWEIIREGLGLSITIYKDKNLSYELKATRVRIFPPGQWSYITFRAGPVLDKEDAQFRLSYGGVLLYKGAAPVRLDLASLEKPDLKKPIVDFAPNGPLTLSGTIQDVRLHAGAITSPQVGLLSRFSTASSALRIPRAERTPLQSATVRNFYLERVDSELQKLSTVKQKLVAEQNSIKERSTISLIQEEKKNSTPMAHILERGDYTQKGEEVVAAIPAALGALSEDQPANRLGLAQWLVSEENPLTARVTVNRFWQEIFGVGLVNTPSDFGIMGEIPSHPELLDWLAKDFQSDWDVKRFFRQIFLSATYRQARSANSHSYAADPENRLLSRAASFRMDAEMIRDYALSISGLLSDKTGGPGARPYQPNDIWNMVGLPDFRNANTTIYEQDKGEGLYRRTVYNFWKRMAPSPNMEIFNAPSRDVCTVKRERTNTPLQALVTMNDIQFVEASRVLAEKVLQSGKGTTPSEAVREVSQRVLLRPLREEELKILVSNHRIFLDHYRDYPDEASKLVNLGETKADSELPPVEVAALTMVTNQVFNLDETLKK